VILVDTTPLVALCDGRDAKHGTALRQLDILTGDELATCDAVITEACFHLPHRSQRLRLRAMVHDLSMHSLPTSPDPAYWLEVFDWLLEYADHQPDWADACLAVLSQREKAVRVWTYDREFRTTWRRPNGTNIPMAVRST
jgi:predicted nucleic acid-binding protein